MLTEQNRAESKALFFFIIILKESHTRPPRHNQAAEVSTAVLSGLITEKVIRGMLALFALFVRW